MYSISDIGVGTIVELNNEPYVVTWREHSKKGRGGAVLRTKLKNLLSGQVLEQTFQGNDKVQPADVSRMRASFLYASGDTYSFMEEDSYEQFEFSADDLGEQTQYLTEGQAVDVMKFNGQPVAIQLPNNLILEVIEAEPGVKGDTAGAASKRATLSTGLVVEVPLFVNAGDKLKIDTRTGDYLSRES